MDNAWFSITLKRKKQIKILGFHSPVEVASKQASEMSGEQQVLYTHVLLLGNCIMTCAACVRVAWPHTSKCSVGSTMEL